MLNKIVYILVGMALIATLAGCQAPTPAGPVTLNVMTHDSFAVTDKVIQQFETTNNAKVNIIKSGDAGAELNKAILTKDAPLADVIYGFDNTFLSRALDAGMLDAYNSPALASIPAEFILDPSNRALPVDYGDVCLNYDKAYFKTKGIAIPQSLEDLTKPEYNGLLVTENPSTSSPGLAFLLATVAHFGPNGYLDYWRQLRKNGLVIVNSWETAYYTNFSASTGKGPQPLVVSYGSSPAAEIVFANPPISESPTGSIVAADTCFRQIEFVGILKGTKQRVMAQKFIDFMLSQSFQEDMPLQMFVFPVLPGVKLPDAYTKAVQIPEKPAVVSPDEIAKNRDTWIQAWTQAVLH